MWEGDMSRSTAVSDGGSEASSLGVVTPALKEPSIASAAFIDAFFTRLQGECLAGNSKSPLDSSLLKQPGSVVILEEIRDIIKEHAKKLGAYKKALFYISEDILLLTRLFMQRMCDVHKTTLTEANVCMLFIFSYDSVMMFHTDTYNRVLEPALDLSFKFRFSNKDRPGMELDIFNAVGWAFSYSDTVSEESMRSWLRGACIPGTASVGSEEEKPIELSAEAMAEVALCEERLKKARLLLDPHKNFREQKALYAAIDAYECALNNLPDMASSDVRSFASLAELQGETARLERIVKTATREANPAKWRRISTLYASFSEWGCAQKDAYWGQALRDADKKSRAIYGAIIDNYLGLLKSIHHALYHLDTCDDAMFDLLEARIEAMKKELTKETVAFFLAAHRCQDLIVKARKPGITLAALNGYLAAQVRELTVVIEFENSDNVTSVNHALYKLATYVIGLPTEVSSEFDSLKAQFEDSRYGDSLECRALYNSVIRVGIPLFAQKVERGAAQEVERAAQEAARAAREAERAAQEAARAAQEAARAAREAERAAQEVEHKAQVVEHKAQVAEFKGVLNAVLNAADPAGEKHAWVRMLLDMLLHSEDALPTALGEKKQSLAALQGYHEKVSAEGSGCGDLLNRTLNYRKEEGASAETKARRTKAVSVITNTLNEIVFNDANSVVTFNTFVAALGVRVQNACAAVERDHATHGAFSFFGYPLRTSREAVRLRALGGEFLEAAKSAGSPSR
jgi:hypothetical protein